MANSKKIIELLTVLCVVQLQYANAVLQFTNKTQFYKKDVIQYGATSFDNGILVYSICGVRQISFQQKEHNCRIVQQKFPYNEFTHSCNVKIITPSDTWVPEIDAMPFGEDRAIFIMFEGWGYGSSPSYVKITTLQFDSCKLSEMKLLDPGEMIQFEFRLVKKIVKYNDSYDVITSFADICDQRTCRITVNSDGQVINGPVSFSNKKIMLISPIDMKPSAYGYIYVSHDDDLRDIWLIKGDGSQKLLKSHNSDYESIAAMHNQIGFCFPVRSGVECTQYDQNGNVEGITTIIPYSSFLSSMQMSPNGGFLVVLHKWNRSASHYNITDYRVFRVDSKGTIIGSIDLEKFNGLHNPYDTVGLHDTDDGKYCTTMMSRGKTLPKQRREESNIVDVATYCFAEEDFLM